MLRPMAGGLQEAQGGQQRPNKLGGLLSRGNYRIRATAEALLVAAALLPSLLPNPHGAPPTPVKLPTQTGSPTTGQVTPEASPVATVTRSVAISTPTRRPATPTPQPMPTETPTATATPEVAPTETPKSLPVIFLLYENSDNQLIYTPALAENQTRLSIPLGPIQVGQTTYDTRYSNSQLAEATYTYEGQTHDLQLAQFGAIYLHDKQSTTDIRNDPYFPVFAVTGSPAFLKLQNAGNRTPTAIIGRVVLINEAKDQTHDKTEPFYALYVEDVQFADSTV